LIEEGKRALSATSGRVRGWRGCCKCSPSGLARVGGTSVGSHGQLFRCFGVSPCMWGAPVHVGCPRACWVPPCMLGAPVHVGCPRQFTTRVSPPHLSAHHTCQPTTSLSPPHASAHQTSQPTNRVSSPIASVHHTRHPTTSFSPPPASVHTRIVRNQRASCGGPRQYSFLWVATHAEQQSNAAAARSRARSQQSTRTRSRAYAHAACTQQSVHAAEHAR
jgi:hypothetical protein